MGQRTQYTPGTFSWTDLTTSDQDGAKAFYTALFGWDVVDNPVGDDMVYSMMQIEGQPVAAISPQPQQQREMGVPPMWNSYVTVADADAAVERAKELGGSTHAPAFDVMDVGRMAVIQDPQGAFFEVWQPKAHIGAHLVNGHGLLSWDELHTTDLEAATSFYTGLFGWTTMDMDMGGGGDPYRVVSVDGHANGGLSTHLQPGAPPHWLVYFGTDDLESSVARVGELGGTIVQPPMDIGEGNRIAVALDPQGAFFALYAGHFED
jgi:predicted enzyme related to lactoylglutathione lyase